LLRNQTSREGDVFQIWTLFVVPRDLKYEWQMFEFGKIDEIFQSIKADITFADVGMQVAMRSQVGSTIIQVKNT